MKDNRKSQIVILGSLRKAHIKKIVSELTYEGIETKVEPAVDGKMFMLIINLRDVKKVIAIASKCIDENNLDVEYFHINFWKEHRIEQYLGK